MTVTHEEVNLTVTLTLAPKPKVWKHLKKVKKNCSHELKHATTTTKMQVAKVRAELKTIGTADLNASAMLSHQCCLSDKLSVLFEPHHVRRIHSHCLKQSIVFAATDLIAGS